VALTVLHLVRHAQPAPGMEAEDPPLSEVGMRQALALGERLRRVPVTEIHHGPSRRTTGTARQLAGVLPDVVPQVSDHLRDRTPVPLPGQASSVAQPHWLAAVPQDERDVEGAAIDAAIHRFAVVEKDERHVVLVTHSFVIGWFVRRVLGLPWDGWIGLQPLPAALTVIAVHDDAPPALVAYNDSGHLTGRLRTDDPLHLDL
jgi:serine/threonine-protein phosphatase PGAM5